MICGECGSEYRRQIRKKNGKEKAVWRCENRLQNGIKYCHYSPTLEEELLHGIILKAINRMAVQIQIGVSETKGIFEIQTEVHIVEEQLGQDIIRYMEIQDIIGKRTYFLNEYNEQLVRKLIRKINVINAFQIEVVFKIGIIIVETWNENDKQENF